LSYIHARELQDKIAARDRSVKEKVSCLPALGIAELWMEHSLVAEDLELTHLKTENQIMGLNWRSHKIGSIRLENI
jgi:hypothetical protein